MSKIVIPSRDQASEFSVPDDKILNNNVIAAALHNSNILISIMKMDTSTLYVNESHEKVLSYVSGDVCLGTEIL